MSSSTTYRANGKLLLTGEYLVLHGAKAIALPLKVGQQMVISENNASEFIRWKAIYQDDVWFWCDFEPQEFRVMGTSDLEKSDVLEKIFRTIKILNPDFNPKAGTNLITKLESNPEWGFGSSSTLISLLSQHSGVDPYTLNELVFNGSGFDIACATADGPISYIRNKPVEPISLNYPFADQLFLVYSGQKKKTSAEVSAFLKEKIVSEQLITEMSALSEAFTVCREMEEFGYLIVQHEKLVGNLIGQTPIKSAFFPDFDGEIKSLGAWGGDFYLISTELSFSEVKKYFENKGLTTMFRWDDLILKRK